MNTLPAAVLALTIIMPSGQEDRRVVIPQASIEDCITEAREFLTKMDQKKLRESGAIGIMASCLQPLPLEQSN